MRDATKYAREKMGFSTSSIPGSVTPADVVEDTCPLCGHFYPLDKNGHCGTDECRRAARQKARRIVRANGGEDIPGLYYRFGDLEVINFTKLECWEPPKQVKHPDHCQTGECTEWALPADYLCRHHRMAEKRDEMLDRNAARHAGKSRQRTKSRKMRGNKIRGLDKIKV